MDITHDEIRTLINGVGVSANVANIKPDESFKKAGIDSLEMMNVFLALEERFDIKIPDEDIQALDTIDNVVNYLRRL
jgi:acyl carrier protein